MRYGPTPRERFDTMDTQKSNRPLFVDELPSQALTGDSVIMNDGMHVWDGEAWIDMTGPLRQELSDALSRIDKLEGEING